MDKVSKELMSESQFRKADEEASSVRLATAIFRNEAVDQAVRTASSSKLIENERNVGFEGNRVRASEIQPNSSMDDESESSNSGFIVIKPSAGADENYVENKEGEGGQGESNVIVIQNSTELSLEGLDVAVLDEVQRALAESGMDHSVMIVNEDSAHSGVEKETSYIIDLNTESKSQSSNSSLSHGVKSSAPSDLAPVTPSSTSLFTNLVTSSLNQDITSEKMSPLKHELVYSSDLSSCSLSETNTNVVSHSIMDADISSTSLALNINDDNRQKEKTTIKSPTSITYSEDSAVKSFISKNLSQSSSSQDNSSPHGSFTSTTSNVAEQLLNIAKKMIGESCSTSQRISVDETLNKIVISPEQKSSKEKSSDSVITMYLSSPNELKSKLEKFKTDSPVIIVQAGEEPLTEEEEGDEEGDDEKPESIKQEKKSLLVREIVMNPEGTSGNLDLTLPKSKDSNNSQSESLAAALSSFTADSVLYSCSECGYSSHNKHYYKQHVDLVHNEDRPYKCPHCDYAGKRRHALLEHMVVHSDQRPYTCSYCNASFRKKGHLTNHVKLHTSQRLVQCGICNIQLPDAEAFESHLRKIHNTNKLYKCKLCDHTVVDRQAMINHLTSHNKSTAAFSCPNCSSCFQEEKALLHHMKESHRMIRVGEEVTTTSSSDKSSHVLKKPAAAPGNENKPTQQANIICSECGFICVDTQVMKKHMWIHIDSSSDMNVQIKGQTPSTSGGAPNNYSAMGVLKMNVVSGLKTLPENVMYQCTSCNFTSSDNSVFIKHMLLHKTQRKSHTPVAKTEVLSENNESISNEKGQGKTISVLANASQTLANTKGKPTSNVPFVFDQSSGRFRCLICGYYCDYQRTIKAHIWKHSGHQNIEYPVFDQTKKVENPPESLIPVTNNTTEAQPKVAPIVSSSSLLPVQTGPIPMPVHQMQLLKTSSGDVVKLLPVDPKTTKYKPGDLIQIKDNAIIVSEKCEKDSPADRFLKTLAAPIQVKSENVVSQVLPNVSQEVKVSMAEEVVRSNIKTEASLSSSSSKISTLLLEQDKKTQISKIEAAVKGAPEDEGCTEPSVVVEIVDTVPSGLGLTGLKSQQGSPRVSDLECSGGELKLSSALKEVFPPEKSSVEESTINRQIEKEQEPGRCNYNLRKSKDLKAAKSSSSVLDETGASEVPRVDSKDKEINLEEADLSSSSRQRKDLKKFGCEEEMDASNSVESDTTESSDEISSAGESGNSSNPPKTGICSSLLAVIEQLRERSRSEGEKRASPTKEISKKTSKRSKKLTSHADAAPLNEFHNIEKIDAGDGEKYRCSLCHYTSQRICNMRIHMKTHRQKKPSECSLCDFSSIIPEALQEHMLQHCKVRTYACKFCPQTFNHKSTLRAHMRAHKDKEPFLCAYCVYEASTPTELKEHMLVHSGCSSRLRCPGCDQIMNNKEELTSHLMKCTGKSDYVMTSDTKQADVTHDQKPTGSVESNVTFPDSSAQNAATNMATEHACVVSGCSFTSFSLKELQDHLSIHCNPALLICDLCDFKALHSRSLKSHMKRHANDQRYVQQPLEQYKCNLCGYVCHHLPSLKSHMWRHASDQSYSYEFTNDVINAAIDHDSRIDANAGEADDPELLDRVINSERRIMEGELTKSGQGDGQRPTCWVTFRCCSCGFETINKAKLNIHMRSHSDIIKQTLDGVSARKPGQDKSNYASAVALAFYNKSPSKRSQDTVENEEPFVPVKVARKTIAAP